MAIIRAQFGCPQFTLMRPQIPGFGENFGAHWELYYADGC